jgi:hypothetical protein
MRIVARPAIPHRRRMHRLCRVELLLVVTRKAERLRCRGRQLDACDIFRDTDFMATQAPGRYGRVHRFPLGLLFVALQALRSVHILV